MKTIILIISLTISLNAQSSEFIMIFDGGVTYSDEATQYFDRLPISIPDDTLAFYAAFIDSMNGRGYWARMDEMWMLANKTQANTLIGMKGLADATVAGTVTFTVYQGIVSNGSTGYINTNYNPSTQGVNFTQNSCSFGVYSRTDNEATVTDMGCNDGTIFTMMRIRKATNSIQSWVNQGVASTTQTNTTSQGLFIVRRNGASTWQNLKNGVNLGGGAQSSTGIPNFKMYVCAVNGSDTPTGYTTREYSFAFVGDEFTPAELLLIFTFLETLLDNLDAGVVS